MLYSSLSGSRYQFSYKIMFLESTDWLFPFGNYIPQLHILRFLWSQLRHCLAVGAIWNLSKFTGSTGKFSNSNFLESRSVLGAKFSGAYNTSTGASKYIQIVKNHYPANFQNLPKLCITFKSPPISNTYFLLIGQTFAFTKIYQNFVLPLSHLLFQTLTFFLLVKLSPFCFSNLSTS